MTASDPLEFMRAALKAEARQQAPRSANDTYRCSTCRHLMHVGVPHLCGVRTESRARQCARCETVFLPPYIHRCEPSAPVVETREPIKAFATAGPVIDCQVANCPIHPSLKAVSR